MERLIRLSKEATRRVPKEFSRYIANNINWNDQLIGISGARGSGKTILLLQYLKKLGNKINALYVSLDDIFFSENKLVYFAEDYYNNGGELLLLDEVHKYPNWSQELKNIYDNLPNLKIIFTSSSALEIYHGSHDLSRRANIYFLAGLSFREFLNLKYKIKFSKLSLGQILQADTKIYANILNKIKPLPLFKEYIKTGYYPFFKNANQSYLKQLMNTINQTIESDLPAIYNIDFNSLLKIKKLISVLSRITPFKPNIEKLARQTEISRDTLLKYLYYLEKAQILKWLSRNTFGINYLNKPDKLYLANTNIAFAFNEFSPDARNLRETFFLNQLSVNHKVSFPAQGDFLVDEKYLFEVGGKNKTQKQIMGIKNAYIAIDNSEYGYKNKIPLWLFGFLY